ncbi:MAG: hypothetical protein M1831_003104 [Alyxoria varia]|nr:MAG: hypothetical protein M1831_003104 [Alyxoria varia]
MPPRLLAKVLLRLTANDRHHPPKYSHPLSSSTARSSTPQPEPRPRPSKRSTWPPSPFVEDEKIALAKEANAPIIADVKDVPNRGSLEQKPFLWPLSEERSCSSSDAKTGEGQGRREDPHRTKKDGTTTPPRAPPNFQGSLRGRVKVPHLGDAMPKSPMVGDRHPSPYTFTPKAHDTSKAPSLDSGYFSGTDIPKSSLGNDKHRTVNESLGISRDALSSSRSRDVTSDIIIDDADEGGRGHGSRVPSRYSSAMNEAAHKEPKSSLRESTIVDSPARPAESKRETSFASHHRSDSSSSLSSSRVEDPPRSSAMKPPPISTAAPRYSGYDYSGYARSDRSAGSRPESPVLTTSSRNGSFSFRDDASISGRSSGYNSRPVSRSGSRPESPAFPDLPYPGENVRRSTTFPELTTFPSIPENSSLHSESLSDVGISMRSTGAKKSSTLPYPLESRIAMPSDEVHKYRPSEAGTTPTTPTSSHRRVSSRELESPSSPSRPALASRRTIDGSMPTVKTAPVETATTAIDKSPTSRRGSSSRRLRDCPRKEPTRWSEYSDWYTLPGCAGFNICRACLENHFYHDTFWKSFKRAPSKESHQKTRCDFASSPWVRLAWLLTQEQHRYDLDLVYDVAKIDSSEPACPNARYGKDTTWCSVLNRHGDRVDNFTVCATDAKKVEALMPTLRGYLFGQKEHSTKYKCAMRVESNRLSEFLDKLVEIDTVARKTRRKPDTEKFIDLARQKAQVRECARDDMLDDEMWHFIPQLPELTVCEECYSTVVWPWITKGYSIAKKFHQTPQLLYNSRSGGRNRSNSIEESFGTSCQLYSDRMRRVFKRAVQDNDYPYLAEQARKRKDKEIELQTRKTKFEASMKNLNRHGDKSGYQKSDLMREADRMAKEWQALE